MRYRLPHKIKRNMKVESPRHIIFFDTETKEVPIENNETQLILKLGVLCYLKREFKGHKEKQKYVTFTTASSFWNFVFRALDEKIKIYLVAHNVAFDFRVLSGFHFMKENGFKTKKLIYNGTSNIWEFSKDGKTICVLDNMNFFKSSLESLGKSVGLMKMQMPDDDSKLEEYCKRDVDIMVHAWKKLFIFLKENDLGNFSKTIAGQAFTSFRHRFMKKEIFIHTNQTAIDLERESYHGGRTECFYIGKPEGSTYFMLDVNSMYPSVMRRYSYPTKLINLLSTVTQDEMSTLVQTQCVIARCRIRTLYPVFPVKIKNKLVFPVGDFTSVLTTRDISYAIQNDMFISCDIACVYERGILFEDYVDFFYSKRKEYKNLGHEAFSYMCKIFLNSLYGKFGQRNEAYEFVEILKNAEDGVHEYFDMDKNINVKERIVNGMKERSIGLREGPDSFVAIASHITADARMQLWKYFLIARRENIYYCDTDSMIVNLKGYLNCKKYIGEYLGYLSLKQFSENLIIKGAKDYIFGDQEVIKGVKKNATRLSDNSFYQTRFEGIAGAIRNHRINKMIISNGTKTFKRNYDKGIVSNLGKVFPFTLNKRKLL